MSVVIERHFEKVPTLFLNRPEKGNALSLDLLRELKKRLEEFAESDQVRGIILEGRGAKFCTGLDLKEATSDESIEEGATLLREIFLLLATYPKPIIASVRGDALAGGLGLALLSDFVIASPDANFQFPEVHRGLVPAFLLTVLKRRFPRSLLRAMSLFAYPLSGVEAYQRGIVHLLVQENEREKKLKEVVTSLLKGAPGTQFHTKTLLERLEEPNLSEELLFAEGLHRKARESDEAREGITAFFEKRPPSWAP